MFGRSYADAAPMARLGGIQPAIRGKWRGNRVVISQ
jgi:hypothetical protein